MRTSFRKLFKIGMGLLLTAAVCQTAPSPASAGGILGGGGGGGGFVGKVVGGTVNTVKKTGGDVANSTKQKTNAAVNTVKKTGGNVANSTKQKTNAAVNTVKKTGGNVANATKQKTNAAVNTVKKTGGDVARYTKEKGGSIATYTKDKARNGIAVAKQKSGELTNYSRDKISHLPENTAQQIKNTPRDVDRTVRTAGRDFSREAGKPWMSAVKRPYDRQVKKAENLYKRGSEAQQRQDVETRREIPDLYGPEDLDYTDVNRSGGSVTSETAGDMPVTTVTAPNGGSIRQEIEPNKEGDTAKARFFVLVQQGSARVTVRDNEGRVLKQGPWESSRDSDPSRPLEVVVDLPSDGKGYGGTDAAHNYIANLELSPGAKVQVYQAEVCHTAENDG